MPDSWLDLLPANERQRLREKYKMSAAAYEKLREKVKGPEDLEQELLRNDMLAQLKFGLESEPEMKSALKQQIEKDIAEKGIEAVLTNPGLPDTVRRLLESGRFDVAVESSAKDAPDRLVVSPSGYPHEVLPVKISMTQSYLAQLLH